MTAVTAAAASGGIVVLKVPVGDIQYSYTGNNIAVGLTPAEAEELRSELDDAITKVLDGHVVLVKYLGGGTAGRVSYAYRDPSGTLKVGDLVEVPAGAFDGTQIGQVSGFGRQNYTGPLKNVTAKLEKTTLTKAPF